MTLKLFNTLSKEMDEFKPVRKDAVRMYNCGPTVYNYVHIGNLRSYVFADVLRRYLEYTGYIVKQVVNITDVGHLTSDADEGEDKMLVAAKKEKKDPWEISKYYADKYFDDLDKLNIQKALCYPKATDHVKEMIEVIKELEKRGYAYAAGGNVYFDTSKFEEYGKLSKFNIQELEAGKRVSEDKNKRNFSDFV
ncbi:MAG: class I tRNA ligase family protein, partial [Nanoarchaeota archaeon]